MFMLISKEPIKVADLQKLFFQLKARKFFQWKQEKIKSFDKARNILMSSEKYILLDFTKYTSFLEVQKNCKIVNV